MFVTALLIIYFIISLQGIYSAIKYCNKEQEIQTEAYPLAACIIVFLLLAFLVVYLKHIITSLFMLWFIFTLTWSLITLPAAARNKIVKKTPVGCVISIVWSLISCLGVMYILL